MDTQEKEKKSEEIAAQTNQTKEGAADEIAPEEFSDGTVAWEPFVQFSFDFCLFFL